MPVSAMIWGNFVNEKVVRSEDGAMGGEKRGRTPVADKYHDQLIAEYPWLSHLDATSGFGGAPDRVPRAKGSSSDKVNEELEVPDDEEIFSAMAALEKERETVAEEGALANIDFVTRVRGRVSSTSSEAAGPMGLQATVRTELAKEFCRRRGLQTTYKCTFSTHGRKVSGVLCRAWCHKMQWLLNKELEVDDGESLEFTEEVLAGYHEPTEVTQLTAEEVHGASQERLAFLKNIPTRMIA